MTEESPLRAEVATLRAESVALKELILTMLGNADNALRIASVALESRLNALNELRSAMSDQGKLMATRQEVDAAIKALEGSIYALSERTRMIAERLDKSEGSGRGLRDGWGYLVAAVGMALAVMAWLARDKLP